MSKRIHSSMMNRKSDSETAFDSCSWLAGKHKSIRIMRLIHRAQCCYLRYFPELEKLWRNAPKCTRDLPSQTKQKQPKRLRCLDCSTDIWLWQTETVSNVCKHRPNLKSRSRNWDDNWHGYLLKDESIFVFWMSKSHDDFRWRHWNELQSLRSMSGRPKDSINIRSTIVNK